MRRLSSYKRQIFNPSFYLDRSPVPITIQKLVLKDVSGRVLRPFRLHRSYNRLFENEDMSLSNVQTCSSYLFNLAFYKFRLKLKQVLHYRHMLLQGRTLLRGRKFENQTFSYPAAKDYQHNVKLVIPKYFAIKEYLR